MYFLNPQFRNTQKCGFPTCLRKLKNPLAERKIDYFYLRISTY